MEYLHTLGSGLELTLVILLCLGGLILSCISLSGTWLVVLAAVAGYAFRHPGFPGVWTLLAFLVIAALTEVAEAFAGAWGVGRRGGSRLAGVAAFFGGIGGLLLGSFIPIPLVGSLLGMLAGSFGAAYAVEYRRLKQHAEASYVAAGAVLARVLVIFVKIGATLGMTIYLLAGMIRG